MSQNPLPREIIINKRITLRSHRPQDTANPKMERDFPLFSIEKDGIKLNTNKIEGEIFYVDKITLEDMRIYQDFEFKILCGYYYDEGRNYTEH